MPFAGAAKVSRRVLNAVGRVNEVSGAGHAPRYGYLKIFHGGHPSMLERPTVQILALVASSTERSDELKPTCRKASYGIKQVRMAINFTAGYDY
jgi:hypothetical protein